MVTRAELNEDDEFVRGYHDIPSDHELNRMSFVQLASLLATCQESTPKFTVVDRELKKRLLKDQSAINLRNVIIGACIGGIFGLSGVIIGAYLKEPPSVGGVARNALPAAQSGVNPASTKNNAKPNNP